MNATQTFYTCRIENCDNRVLRNGDVCYRCREEIEALVEMANQPRRPSLLGRLWLLLKEAVKERVL